MKARINKLIIWDGKEYAHIIEDEPNQFCDLCSFSELCGKVVRKELAFEDSPMKLCEELCKPDIHYAMFIPSEVAESYIKHVNNETERLK